MSMTQTIPHRAPSYEVVRSENGEFEVFELAPRRIASFLAQDDAEVYRMRKVTEAGGDPLPAGWQTRTRKELAARQLPDATPEESARIVTELAPENRPDDAPGDLSQGGGHSHA